MSPFKENDQSFKGESFVMKGVLRLTCLMSFIFCLACSSGPADHGVVADFNLPDDLEATLWATSPMFYNPTNMDVDINGRVWITEAVNYRTFNNDSVHNLHHSKGDRVMILEDKDHDGKAETSKVFIQDKDLVSPLGIAVIGNKVIVSCSPNIIVYTDDNHDDIPDKKEIFLTGFGGLDHDHSLHAVVEGPDGLWYFNTGNAGPHIVKDHAGWTLRAGSLYTGGSPYNKTNKGNMVSDDGKVWVGGLALRIDPDGKGLKVMGHNFRNSYESAIDSYGNLWQNDNDDQVVACRTSWLMEGGNAGYFSNDGTRYWQADQRPWQDIFAAHWHQGDPGVMPAGDKSGAGAPTGIVRYEGDVLGAQYQGMVFSADAGRNVVFGYKPEPDHSGYAMGTRSNFLTSLIGDNAGYVWNDSAQNAKTEKWFRPSDVVVGTDGTLFVADWYDPVVGGHQMGDSLGYGRIYRIKPKGKNPETPPVDLKSWTGLIKAFRNPAIHLRAAAFNEMASRGEVGVSNVKALLKDNNKFIQARAVWLMSKLGKKGVEEVTGLIDSKDPMIRSTAFRALRQVTPDILPIASKLANDTSAFVRREVIVSLRDLPFDKTKPILLKLASSYDGSDGWYLAALASSCHPHEQEIYDALVNADVVNKDPLAWSSKASDISCTLHPSSIADAFSIRASDSLIAMPERSKAITALAFINTTKAVEKMIELSKSSLKQVAEEATYWLSFRQSNDWFSLVDWTKSGINPEHERNVATMKVKLRKILDDSLPFDEKKWNARDMAGDPVGGQMLLSAVADHKISNELYPFIADIIFKNPDPAVRIQASGYFVKPRVSISYAIPEIVRLSSQVSNGMLLFEKNCTVCHTAGKKGGDVGPNLSTIGQKFDKEGILDAIINPSSGIVFGYEPWLITTSTGESFYGFLIADGEKSITIKDIAGRTHTVATTSVTSRKKQENSIMPEASAFGFTEQDLADVATYLLTQKTAN
ncbi:MAG: PVC-type heme-binding CxxCH protein [Chryseolinea sp.]